METVVSTLSILPSTKDEIKSFAAKLEYELENGVVNPLDLLKAQKCIEKTFDAVKPKLMGLALTEAEKYGKSFEYKGIKIEQAEVGAKYDYSSCGHIDYDLLCKQIDELLVKKKDYETMLKTLKDATNMISNDGETMTVYPPKKSSTSSLKVTL